MPLHDAADYEPTWMTRVAVFDQHSVASCCAQVSRGGPRNRYSSDIGPHYIGDCGAGGKVTRILAGPGIGLDVVPFDADGFDVPVFPEFRFAIPVGLDAFRDRFVRFLREIDALLTRVDRNSGRMSWSIAWHALRRRRLARKYRGATLKDLLDSCSTDPQVRAMMAGQNGDYGLPPGRVSAALHAGLSNHYFHGAYHPRGGGQIIADRLSQVIEDGSGSVHPCRGVEKIPAEDDRAVGVLIDGSDFEAFCETARDMIPRGAYITSATMKEPATRHHAPAGISDVEAMTVLSGKPGHWGIQGRAEDWAQNWEYKHDGRYPGLKARIEQDMIARVDAPFPGSRDAAGFCESATPGQFFEHRPGYSGPLPGLFFAGASTRAGHGVLGAALPEPAL